LDCEERTNLMAFPDHGYRVACETSLDPAANESKLELESCFAAERATDHTAPARERPTMNA